MDLLFHCNNLTLSNVRVKSVLHLALELNLSLPEKDLSLSFNDLSQDIGLLFLKSGDVAFKPDGLILELLELLLELILNVEVVVGHLCLLSSVLIVQVIELVHLEVEVLQSNLKCSDFFLVSLHR